MQARDEGSERFAVTSIPGILAALMGLGTLSLYYKWYTPRSPTLKSLQFTLGAVLLIWGLKAVFFTKRRRQDAARWGRWTPYHAYFTREGLVYVGIMMTVFIGAMLGRSNLLLLVFGLLSGPFVINGYITLTMLQKIGLRRMVPERVMVGEQFPVEIEMKNRRWWMSSWMMVVYDRIVNQHEVLRPSILFARVAPRSEQILRYHATLMQRGRYQFGPLRLTTRFPLGLVDRSLTLVVPNEILVHPYVGQLSPHWRRDVHNADELVQQQRSRVGAYDDEFHRLREYRVGDNPRAIHWRTSARRNALVVREYHQSRDRDLAIILDLWIPTTICPGDQERVELAISFAATLCVDYCRNHRESNLFLGIGGRKLVPCVAPAGPLSIRALLDELATAQPNPSADLAKLAQEPFLRRGRNVRGILVTTRPLQGDARRGLDEVQAELAHRGIRPRLIEADPQTLSRYYAWES